MLCSIGCFPLLASGTSVDRRVPAEARAVVASVAAAAQNRDLAKLRPLMADQFAHVFRSEGDAKRDSADDAIAFWKKHPELIQRLARTTKSVCAVHGQEVICPGSASTGFRAIFQWSNGRWLMTAFLEGD